MNGEKKQEQNSESRELGIKPIVGLFVKCCMGYDTFCSFGTGMALRKCIYF